MKIADLALLALGIVGLPCGISSIAQRPDLIGIVLAMVQLAAGGLSLLVALKAFPERLRKPPKELKQ